ncbi:MAG: hypothetical protein JO356_06375 [Acidobacteria bacterium]|nr:hypothetical protein [Acidobacteriota bacterium]
MILNDEISRIILQGLGTGKDRRGPRLFRRPNGKLDSRFSMLLRLARLGRLSKSWIPFSIA